MKIHSLKINHLKNPLGYLYKTITASYIAEGSPEELVDCVCIIVSETEDYETIVFDTGWQKKMRGTGTRIEFPLKPRQRYFWKVLVWDQAGNSTESETAWFETGLIEEGFRGESITPDMEPCIPPVFVKKFYLAMPIKDVRLYMTCLGVYEAFINGKRIGDEVLAPGITSYNQYVQYQTYDISEILQEGFNVIEISAGDGWYKGMYGYRQNEKYRQGKGFELLADLYVDGKFILCSDLSWKVKKNKISKSDIYNGEYRDDTLDDSEYYPVKAGMLDKSLVRERMGLPIRIKETIFPLEIIYTPAGESVLDMGQNMVGWVTFCSKEAVGHKVTLEYGEVLQNGCFYRENYRTAKARFDYVSDGKEKDISARLCFFGFRYVRLTGFSELKIENFRGQVIYSDLKQIGDIKTGNDLVNKLISNILWSQKGNFLDIPTDCPQRDEKLGWTGDAQIFSGTACLNMDCYTFFRKYLNDIALEQSVTDGLVPQVVPSVGRNERTSAAWGDAALVIPWKMYQYYGDASILEEQYESMKGWIAYIDKQNSEYNTNPDLWQNGFHYGDWLAPDGGYYHMPTGGTNVYYISSAWFYHSTDILANTAAVLGKKEDFQRYRKKADSIKQAIQNEYFTINGDLSIDTQTAYILAIEFKLLRDEVQKGKIKDSFIRRIRRDGYKLQTGFIGTPLILDALSDCGRSDLAYLLLLGKECPGWLYPVTLQATTMWERWDALDSVGIMSDTGMNSLNHYANGSVKEWMYCHMAGIRPKKDGLGFTHVLIHPEINPEIGWMKLQLETMAGLYKVFWEIQACGRLKFECQIPYGAEAEVILPFVQGSVLINGRPAEYQDGQVLKVPTGVTKVEYELMEGYHPHYQMEDSVKELVGNPIIKEYLYEKIPMLRYTDQADIQNMTLNEMSILPFFLGIGNRIGLEEAVLKEIESFISKIRK